MKLKKSKIKIIKEIQVLRSNLITICLRVNNNRLNNRVCKNKGIKFNKLIFLSNSK